MQTPDKKTFFLTQFLPKWFETGDAFSPSILNFVLEYTVKRVQVKHKGLKRSGTHHLLVYVNDVNTFGESIYITNKNTEILLVATDEDGLELNVGRTI